MIMAYSAAPDKMSMKHILLCVCIFNLLLFSATAQGVNDHKYRVLFLGNSYTFVNNLPLITANAAASVGDTLVYDMNAIGGYTLQQHSVDATSLGKIAVGNWDYVVLQEQSQLPSFPIEQVDTEVFPYAKLLDSVIHHDNSCGRTIFYMTWGREFGDTSNCAFWPPVCTYNGMDSMLYQRYMMMADSNNALVSPVGAVRHYIINNYPTIQLYQPDQSHPTEAGTYAAACTFYTTIFKKDPTLITYNFSLPDSDAAHIKLATKLIVYDSLSKWHIGQYDASAQATYTITGAQVAFTNTSANATSYTWSFGDGSTSTLTSPIYNYSSLGVYTVTLVAINCGKSDTQQIVVNLLPTGVPQQSPTPDCIVSPNPAHNYLSIHSTQFLSQGYDILITNTLGQIVHCTRNSIAEEQEIDVSNLAAGIYMFSVFNNGQQIYRSTFIKN
jgi:Secretion system C-terminal sorting domain/PKD domain